MVGDYQDPAIKERADRALDLLFTWVLENNGAITGEHGIGLAKKRWFRGALGEVSYDVHQSIKQALDPTGLLNPGKFL
jgi:FAD/FMN-containing dehydrogenase